MNRTCTFWCEDKYYRYLYSLYFTYKQTQPLTRTTTNLSGRNYKEFKSHDKIKPNIVMYHCILLLGKILDSNTWVMCIFLVYPQQNRDLNSSVLENCKHVARMHKRNWTIMRIRKNDRYTAYLRYIDLIVLKGTYELRS